MEFEVGFRLVVLIALNEAVVVVSIIVVVVTAGVLRT